jgi:hypothetical protein
LKNNIEPKQKKKEKDNKNWEMTKMRKLTVLYGMTGILIA